MKTYEPYEFHIVVGQRKESYPGEYAPEALAVMDEYGVEDNGQWLQDTLAENRSSGDFEAVEIVRLEVPREAIMAILRPATREAIPATITQ